jgi:hypothetical protein
MWWVEIFLMLVIIALLGGILFGRGGVVRERRLRREIRGLQEKVERYESFKPEGPLRPSPVLFDFVRDLEILRSAIAGSGLCRKVLYKKYKLQPGPELLKRILLKTRLDPSLKERLADEFLVGEIGRGIMQSLERGATIERAAAEVGAPLAVAKGQVRRLQILGYLDGRLKPTEAGWRALRS